MSKKIIVLVMSCKEGLFQHMEKVVRETWAKPILDGEYEDISYYSYTGGNNKAYIDEKEHRIYCKSCDGLWETYQKTCECLRLLFEKNKKFDYVFRTNTSTVNNIGLLRAFTDSLANDQIVYGGELYNINIPCPTNGFLYLRGNSMLIPRKYCELILDWDKHLYIPDKLFADDNIMGNIFNTYHLLRYEPYIDYLKSYGFAWYKSTKEKDTTKNNGCSAWYNTDDQYNYLKNFISIQVKSYEKDRNVDNEEERMRHVSGIVNIKKNDYSQELAFIKRYSSDPCFFYNNYKKNISRYFRVKDALAGKVKEI